MALSAATQDLFTRNGRYASAYRGVPSLGEISAKIAADPGTPRVCILTCADPRVIPEQIFQLGPGEAVVVRTAGGSVHSALTSLLAIDSLLGFTDLVLMKHTDCGTTVYRDEEVRAGLKARVAGEEAAAVVAAVEQMEFHDNRDGVEEELTREVAFVKGSPLIREELKRAIVPCIYDLAEGKVRVVN